MAKSTYYFELNRVDAVAEKNCDLLSEIKKIFHENKGIYGVRRIYQELCRRGFVVNHKRVQRLMHVNGLFGKRPKEKYHSYQGNVGKVAANIINRDFTADRPLQKWSTDVSQFTFSWGKCFFSPILDMSTNEIISYDLSLNPNLEQVQRMLNIAFKKFPDVNGLILHSDQGWQYQHAFYQRSLEERGIIQSMSRKGNCYDNCIIETFFARMKNEMFYGFEKEYSTFKEFQTAVEEYIDYYNNKRIQRLMHINDLFGKRPKQKYHSYRGSVGKVADNIINRDFVAKRPLQKWSTDVSQFTFSWGKCFFSPILDMSTNEIISYDLSLSPDLEQIQRMLNRAFKKFPDVNGLILHSDQGWQYQHAFYQRSLNERGIIQSMSRKGNCYDNCIIETFFARMKNEMFYGFEMEYSTFKEFQTAVEEYIDYYNNKRIQEKTKWMPPVLYRETSMCSA